MSAEELDADALRLELDLGLFDAFGHVHHGDVCIEAEPTSDGYAWAGEDGWLSVYSPGDLLAVRVEPVDRSAATSGGEDEGDEDVLPDLDARVELSLLETPPPAPGDELPERVRATYEQELGETGPPLDGRHLTAALLAEDPSMFAAPMPPLSELCEAAGLEARGGLVADGVATWHRLVIAQRTWRVLDLLGPKEVRVALGILDVADLLAAIDPSLLDGAVPATDPAALRHVLRELADEQISDVVRSELFEVDDELTAVDPVARGEAFAEALLAAAQRPTEVAVARLFAAFAAERRGEPLVALRHLELAHLADPRSLPVAERLGWYEFERGNPGKALALWADIDADGAMHADLEIAREMSAARRPEPGRNEPCWCGSGRKYKQCHAGEPSRPPLADRVTWMLRKQVAYLRYRGQQPSHDLLATALARSATLDDELALRSAAADPIVADLVLHEGRWAERYLDERGTLLPDDELLLLRSWTLVERSVHEVVGKRSGGHLRLRDLRTGDEVEVVDHAASRTLEPGMRVCARLCPVDEELHTIVGGIFAVKPGTEDTVLELCEGGDAMEMAAYLASLAAPPTIVRKPGMLREMVGDLFDDEPPLDEADLLERIRGRFEENWCDESVPALQGLTPRQAVADPTRRDDVVRLIDSFDRGPQGPGAMRPARLRELLGL